MDKPESLCPKFEGPYPIHSRPSRSTITVELGKKKNGDLRLQTYHWSSAKVAHLRDGFVAAQRPKLGRPSKLPDTSLSSNTSELNKNPSANSSTSGHGDTTGSTDQCQQTSSTALPVSQRQQTSSVPPSNGKRNSNRPITARKPGANQPITAASESTRKPANIQTPKTHMRPVRATRNRNPTY